MWKCPECQEEENISHGTQGDTCESCGYTEVSQDEEDSDAPSFIPSKKGMKDKALRFKEGKVR